jgi:hypothetical protein
MEVSEQLDFIDGIRSSSQGDREYHVHWKKFTHRVPSWERAIDLPGCDYQIDAFTRLTPSANREERRRQEIALKVRQDEANIRSVFPDRGSRPRVAAVRSQEPRERGRKLSLTVSTAERVVIRPQTFDCAHIEEPLADRVPFEHIDGFKKSSMSPNFVPVAIVDRRFESGGVIYYAVQGPNGEVFWLSTAQCAKLCPGLITYFLYAKVAKLMGFDEMP